jgi:hypothetical protein
LTDLTEDRVWEAISEGILGRTQRRSNTGFVNICCPMCVTRGESVDRKHRCGIISSGGSVGVSCFNCNFKCVFRLGRHLGLHMKEFLGGLGVPDREISRIALWAEQKRRQMADDPILRHTLDVQRPVYSTIALPAGARSLQEWLDQGCNDPNFVTAADYLLSRGDVAVTATTYYWTPETHHDLHRRLIIPCYHDDRLVGWSARAVDDTQPRYHKEIPSNYLFNARFMSGPRRYVFIAEGMFDALGIDAVSPLGAMLNERQISWINRCGKRPVVVPQRDTAGNRLVEIAIKQQWSVAGPHYGRHQWWDADIKDAADAVRRYGKPYVVQSILATLESDAGKIQQRASYLLR